MPRSASSAFSIAEAQIKRGHSVDLGLMQINSANLAALGMTVQDAFDVCRSLAASDRILSSAFAAGSSEAERQAALLISLSKYNTGQPLAGIANGYANRVIAVQSAAPDDDYSRRNSRGTLPQWDIWGASGAGSASWIVSTDGSLKNERAGAQPSDARNEGRASEIQGEPNELSAFQESKPSKP
jgi:hypothetical protein